MNFCISWISKDHPISCIPVSLSLGQISSAQLYGFTCHLLLQIQDAEFQGWGGVPWSIYPVYLRVKSPHHRSHSWALLWAVWEGRWSLLLIAKVPHQWLGTSSPESTWKGICPVRALLSGNDSAQWEFLQSLWKWESIECSGGSLGVSWRSSLVDMNIKSSSEDINLPTALLMSLYTQVRLVGVSDLKGAAGWCWCGSAHM